MGGNWNDTTKTSLFTSVGRITWAQIVSPA